MLDRKVNSDWPGWASAKKSKCSIASHVYYNTCTYTPQPCESDLHGGTTCTLKRPLCSVQLLTYLPHIIQSSICNRDSCHPLASHFDSFNSKWQGYSVSLQVVHPLRAAGLSSELSCLLCSHAITSYTIHIRRLITIRHHDTIIASPVQPSCCSPRCRVPWPWTCHCRSFGACIYEGCFPSPALSG